MARTASRHRSGTSSSRPSVWSWAQVLIRSARTCDGVGVAEGGEAVDAERVEVVAGEQGEVGVVAGEQARLAVVEEVALADRLDDERVLAGGGGARPGGGEVPSRRRRDRPRAGRSACPPRAAAPARILEGVDRDRSPQRLLERLGGRFERAVDRRLVVGERDEPGLELGGRRVDAAVEHRPAEAGVGLECRRPPRRRSRRPARR